MRECHLGCRTFKVEHASRAVHDRISSIIFFVMIFILFGMRVDVNAIRNKGSFLMGLLSHVEVLISTP